MDLQNKAAWHTQLNGGLIPVLEMPDGTLLHESKVLMELANDLGGDKGLALYSKDKIIAAKQRMTIEGFQIYSQGLFNFFFGKGSQQEKIQRFDEVLIEMEEYFCYHTKRDKSFLLGCDQPSMADLNIFPFVERIVLLENSPMGNVFYALNVKDHAPTIVKYVNAFR